MSKQQQKVERVLERIEPGRRDAVRKILLGATAYAAPVVAPFSMGSLGGVAQAQVPNQTEVPTIPVPTTSVWGLAGLVATLGAAGALLVRRIRRDRDS
jgi:hypothetical protein